MKNSIEPKTANKILGQIIKSEREKKGITQKELAKKIGIQESTMGGIESGRRPPTPVIRRALCKEFKIENLLVYDTKIDLPVLNLIQESLELWQINENELEFIINELKVSFGFDTKNTAIIEDIVEKQKKNIKSINETRQNYIKVVIKNILEIIYSIYKVGEAKYNYGMFSYFLLHFYKQDFEKLVKFPSEYKNMMDIRDEENNKKAYFEVKNKNKVINGLSRNFKYNAKNNWFLNEEVYRFDIENNKETYSQIRGKNNGFYYGQYKIDIRKGIADYREHQKSILEKYNNNFKKFGTVYEFQLLMLETLDRLEKNYILHNNAIPIHILPKYNIIDGYENLDIKLASDKYEYIAVKIDKSLSRKYEGYKEDDVITIQLGNNCMVGDDIYIWSKIQGFNIGNLVRINEKEICIKNKLGEFIYNFNDLKQIGIIAKNNKIYYRTINDNFKKDM